MIASDKDREYDQADGLDLVDAFLAKSHPSLVLIAQARALVCRAQLSREDGQLAVVEVGGLTVDPVARRARWHGRSADLTPREFDVLYHLAEHAGTTRHDLLRKAWNHSSSSIDSVEV